MGAARAHDLAHRLSTECKKARSSSQRNEVCGSRGNKVCSSQRKSFAAALVWQLVQHTCAMLISCSNSPSWPSWSRCRVSVVTHKEQCYRWARPTESLGWSRKHQREIGMEVNMARISD